MDPSKTILRIVRLACMLTLMGYALKHFTWNGRLISQVYSEGMINYFARLLQISWRGFFVDGAVNPAYQWFIYAVGGIFTMGSLSVLTPVPVLIKGWRIYFRFLLYTCTLLIVLTAFSGIIETKLHLNVLIEYSIKIAVSLLFLYYALGSSFEPPKHIRLLKWIIALTFIGHGVYALNIFPIPANFMMMTSSILKTGRDGSILFLAIFGALDIVASMLLFFRKTEKPALIYMIIWGFLTALARLVAYHGSEPTATYLAMWAPEFLVRAGHFLLPLYLLMYLQELRHKRTLAPAQ